MKPTLSAHEIWQGFHWTFFINVQGLILSLLRFQQALVSTDLTGADTELRCAAALLRASGAAMRLGGSFSPQAYAGEIRVSMSPPQVEVENFSGLMSWDHARLMCLWRELGPRFGDLPAELAEAYQDFLQAYVDMIGAHRAVCSRFVGETAGSLRSRDPAVGVLERVLQNRLQTIDPNQTVGSGCPFSKSRGLS